MTVSEVSYLGSQPWPFPSGIMIGFRARALTEAIDVDGDELEEAHWFTRDQARAANVGQRHDSIEHYLIEGGSAKAISRPSHRAGQREPAAQNIPIRAPRHRGH